MLAGTEGKAEGESPFALHPLPQGEGTVKKHSGMLTLIRCHFDGNVDLPI
jgi:hypothetical protein